MVDSINFVLNDNALLEIDAEIPIIKSPSINPDTVFINHIQSIINQSFEMRDNKRSFKAYYLLSLYYLQKHDYKSANNELNNAKNYAQAKHEYIPLYYTFSKLKIETGQYVEALEYLRQSKQLAIDTKDAYTKAVIILQEGFCYANLNKYHTAENLYKEAFSIIESNALRKLYGEIFKYRGHLQFVQLNYLNALANFYKGLEFFDQDTIVDNYALILEYIGRIYYTQGNYKKASEYFTNANLLYSKVKNFKSQAEIEYRLGLCNIKIGNNIAAFSQLNNSLSHYKLIHYNKGETLSYLALSKYFIANDQPDSSLYYLKTASLYNDILDNKNETELLYNYYSEYANYYIHTKNADSAIYFANRAAKINNLNLIQSAHIFELLSVTNSLAGSYKKAFLNKSKSAELKDSLNNYINSYEIKILQSELELSQSKVIIEHLNENRIAQNKTIEQSKELIERQKFIMITGYIVTSFILILVLLLTVFLYQKRKDNKKLTTRNFQIEQQKEEIEQQSIHLQKINNELEELSVIARETDNGIKIMNAVGRILWVNEGYTKMHGYELKDLQEISNLDLLGEHANINIQQLVNVWYGDKQPITFESLNKTKDNKQIWVQTTLTPILNEEGKIDKMIAIDSDITQIKKAENEILIKNRDITASISYAKRIQEAMMPPFNILTEKFKNSYHIYKPKSIVSGDFYWITKRHDRLVVVCADSTGHGVPGAFMSMIGISFLNKIVNEKGFISPNIILNRMRLNIINHLRQEGSESLSGDGMDMAVITLDKKNKKLEYAGAMNPVYVVRDNNIIELKADRMPVGYFDNEDRPFSTNTMNIEKGDTIFMFTDGFYDQFGGDSGSKMKSHRFKDLLIETSTQPFNEQKQFLIERFNKWKGQHPQIDDILLISIIVD